MNELQTGQRFSLTGFSHWLWLSEPPSHVTPPRQRKCGMPAVKGAVGQLSMEQEQVQAATELKASEKQYYWSHLSIHPVPMPLLVLLLFGWIRPPLCTHGVSQRCAAGSQWVPTGLPPLPHPPLLSGAGTAPWIGHLSWRTWAASGCLCWALQVRAAGDKTV